MVSSDEQFAREFKRTTSTLTSQIGGKYPISELPSVLPNLTVDEGQFYKVEGIENEIFSVMNGRKVIRATGIKPERSVFDRAGKRKYDIDGNALTEKVTTPGGSVFVRTDEIVPIPFKFSDPEYTYANRLPEAIGSKYTYMYSIPKRHLYRMNRVALAVSSKTLKCYKGFQFKTWHYGTVTLAVIPYNANRTYTDTVILGTKNTIDFNAEITVWVNRMVDLGIVPNIPDFFINGYENLVVTELNPTYTEFEELSMVSLDEEKSVSYSTILKENEDDLDEVSDDYWD